MIAKLEAKEQEAENCREHQKELDAGICCPRPLGAEYESIGVIGNTFCFRFLDPLSLSLFDILQCFPDCILTVHFLIGIDRATIGEGEGG